MLDKAKVLQALQEHSDKLFLDISQEFSVARASWQRVVSDPLFAQKVLANSLPWQIPLWQNQLGTAHHINLDKTSYTVVGVDGSQIYPDKHQGTTCSLINIGIVEISYGIVTANPVRFACEPHVMIPKEEDTLLEHTVDTINCHRQELEFLAAYEWCTTSTSSPVVLCDGSLIFWHLESKEPVVKHTFLTSYLALLQQLYEARIVMGGYISMPKSKDLVNMIRAELCNFKPTQSEKHKQVDHLVDAHVASFFLEPYQRSQLFQSVHAITHHYPAHLRPYFFYMHVGTEIVRIEVPAWIAHDEAVLNRLCYVMLDQALKGGGYPVVLAEAHEQAVVKGPDREFFYHLIQKLGIEQHKRLMVSPKSLKKRGIGV